MRRWKTSRTSCSTLILRFDDAGRGLIWNGETKLPEEPPAQTANAPAVERPASAPSAQPDRETPTGERRQLTVMFCDLVGSTALSEQLDPEELQTVVRTYQEVSAQVIERYAGYIAQYLGDGLLVYFGYLAAHEDDAARSIRAGLEIVAALDQARSQFPQPVQVRIGIHTGPVVVGQMGGGSRHEQLALGETPNVAARVQGKAEPDEVVISAATQHLVVGLFECEDRGLYELKGISTPQSLYRVKAESVAHSRFEVALQTGLTPLVGRESELGILRERWTQAQAGNGQAVLLSGEPGIGKSRLVQELKAQATQAGATQIAFHCSPYHQNSALYPIIEHLQRLLQFASADTSETKLDKLQQTLGRYSFPQAHTLPLLAAFLSLPHPAGVPSLTMSPQKQKELTQAALVAWLIEETEQQLVYNSWEDLHWADPSTLEVLDLLLPQVPTTRLLAVLTFRPEFVPPWGTHSYLSQLTLSRLGQSLVNVMVERVTGGKALPEEVVHQIVTKTDGVPLFVEELTKMVIESGLVQAVNHHYELTGPLAALAIPSTLQDSLMARLDRLATVREVAQLGATIGREFSYELIHAVSLSEEAVLQQGLQQLVEAELVFQHGLPPQARYTFKHALIQDTAYASLLKSTRHQYHRQIAQVLEAQFAETVDAQPELVAHHYTEAGLIEQALPYWQRAGERAAQRSAHVEAIGHWRKSLALLQTLPDTPERTQQELRIQTALGTSLMATKGFGVPEVEQAFRRARELCQQVGETPQLLLVLRGLRLFHYARAEHQAARDLAEQFLRLVQLQPDTAFRVEARYSLGATMYWLGELAAAQEHLEQGLALYDANQHRLHAVRYGFDPGCACLSYMLRVRWVLGYPDQAWQRRDEALALARELAHPFSLAWALNFVTWFHWTVGEMGEVQKLAEELTALATEQVFPLFSAQGILLQGVAMTEQGEVEEGIVQIRQGMIAYRGAGMVNDVPQHLVLLAAVYRKAEQAEQGLPLLAEALAIVQRTGERLLEAELYRLTGELTLESNAESQETPVAEVEAYFLTALEVAQRQQAKSWELRAATSLARLWQQQGKTTEAHALLAPVYDWFTEGFDTVDLKDAKSLLEQLS